MGPKDTAESHNSHAREKTEREMKCGKGGQEIQKHTEIFSCMDPSIGAAEISGVPTMNGVRRMRASSGDARMASRVEATPESIEFGCFALDELEACDFFPTHFIFFH